MTQQERQALMAQLMQGGKVEIGQLSVGDNNTMNYYAEKKEEASSDSTLSPRQAIMDYVGRLRPLVVAAMQDTYEALWQQVLDLPEVRQRVYNRGRQQGTTFNRDLVAQIVHVMGTRVYVPTARAVQMAECLEPAKGRDHPVRQRLGENPEAAVKKTVEQQLEKAVL